MCRYDARSALVLDRCELGALFSGWKPMCPRRQVMARTTRCRRNARRAIRAGCGVGKFLKTVTYQQVSARATAMIGEYCSRCCAIETSRPQGTGRSARAALRGKNAA